MSSQLVVMLGSGGVGKTTSAVALAYAFAATGRKVALLSIDPARRLADALKIQLGSQLQPLDHLDSEFPSGGRLSAMMVDQKRLFDEYIHRFAASPAQAQKILKHSLYQACSENFSGPLEYLALAKLEEVSRQEDIDVVVLDTPPDTHAIDFLNRPSVLGGFQDKKIIRWLVQPFLYASKLGLGRLVSLSEKLMGGVSQVLGWEPLLALSEFLVLMKDVIAGFDRSGKSVAKTLRSNKCHFAMVANPTLSSARKVFRMYDLLDPELQSNTQIMIWNRCLPFTMDSDQQNGPTEGASYSRRSVGEAQVMESAVRKMASIQKVTKIPESPQGIEDLAAIRSLAQQWFQDIPEHLGS